MPWCEDSCHSAEIVIQNLLLMKFIDSNQDRMDSVHSYVLLYMWEKLLMAAAEQLLEQNRQSQAVRRLLDSNRENDCKE